MSLPSKIIDALFPFPSPPPSTLSPTTLTGTTHKAQVALINALKNNHVLWDAFVNEEDPCDHCVHHLLTIYALGASPSLIEASYQRHVLNMRATITDVEPITPENYFTHLGDARYYKSYLEFFVSEVRRRGSKPVLEGYVFSREANVAAVGPNEEPPRMLARFLAESFHPLAHVGYGLEFGLPGLLIEGLALTATRPVSASAVIPADYYFESMSPAALAVLLEPIVITSLALEPPPLRVLKPPRIGPHALEILSRVLTDKRFEPSAGGAIGKMLEGTDATLHSLANEWYADGKDAKAKVIELFWLNTIMYGVGGWGKHRAGDPNADFAGIHLVTSSLFLPSFAAYLSPASFSIFMRSFFFTSLAWYISHRRPSLPFSAFYASTTAHPNLPEAPPPSPNQSQSQSRRTPDASDQSPNPWLPFVQNTLQHCGGHIHELQRALLHFSRVLGGTPAGTFSKTGLVGAEVLDGTLFVRVARLIADHIG